MREVWAELFSFANYGELLVLVNNSIIAGAVVGLIDGLVGVFVIARDLPFAVHGVSELSFAGASAALLLALTFQTWSRLPGRVTMTRSTSEVGWVRPCAAEPYSTSPATSGSVCDQSTARLTMRSVFSVIR